MAIGKHKYYYPNGKVKLEGAYEAGERDGNWKYYSEEGILLLTIKYLQGEVSRLDGAKLKLPKEWEE